MEPINNKYSEKLKTIFDSFIAHGIINDDEVELDFNIISRDLEDLNKNLNITYLIFSDENTSNEEKAETLSKLKDLYGNNLLTLPQSRQVVKIYKTPLLNFFKKFYNRKINILAASQQEGFTDNTAYKTDMDDRIRRTVDQLIQQQNGGGVLSETSTLPKIPLDTDKIAADIDNIPVDIDNITDTIKTLDDNINAEDAISIYSEMYDWIFHPLWKLENNSLVGFIFPIPLDIIGAIIDTVNLINPFVMIVMSRVVAVVGTGAAAAAGGAIGTAIGALFAGVGAAVGGPIGPAITAGFWPAIGQPIIIWILDHYIDVISLFYNVSRKKMGLAYLSALDAIPYFEVILDFFVKKLLRVNKKLEQLAPITNNIRTGAQITDSIVTTILDDPDSLLNVDTFYKKLVKKNLRKLPQFRNMSDEDLELYEQHMEKIYRTGKKSIDCVLNTKAALIKNSKAGKSNLGVISGCFNNFDITAFVRGKIPGPIHNLAI